MKMQIDLKNNTSGRPTVDLNAELYTDIPEEIFVSRIAKQQVDYSEINFISTLFQISNIISKKASQMEYHALIKSGKISLCEFFKNPDREPVLKVILGNLEKFGHMMFNCPVKKVNITFDRYLNFRMRVRNEARLKNL